MKKRSKRYLTNKSKIEAGKMYSIEEAISLIKLNPTKYDQGVEIHVKLGIDPKKSDQLIRGVLNLPHGTGKTKRVIAFVGPENEQIARDAGADIIGDDNEIAKIKQTSKISFDVAIATPAMMKKITPIAKILGQKGLMPNPKTDTIGTDIKKMITSVKAGKIAYKNDDTGNVHALVGRIKFEDDKIKENVEAFINSIKKAKPATSKGVYLKNVVICTSMGPSVRLNIK